MADDNLAVAQSVSALTTLHALIVSELDRLGIMPKSVIVDLVKAQVAQMEAEAAPDSGPRIDIRVLRGFLSFVENPPPGGWTPIVIDGGKDH